MIIFFINRYNDIDHMVPIGYKLASGLHKVMFLCINPFYDIESDYRLRYLKNNYSVIVDYVYSYYCPTMIHKLFGALIRSMYFQKASKKKIKFLLKRIRVNSKNNISLYEVFKYLFFGIIKKLIYSWIFEKNLKYKYYNDQWVDEAFNEIKPSLLIFDYAARRNLLIVDQLISSAKKKSINVIYVPHGVYFFPFTHNSMIRHCLPLKDQKPDGIVVSYNRWKKGLINHGLEPNKIHAFGSARFCREWRNIIRNIIPNDDLQQRMNSKLRVLYVERQGDRHGIYKEIVQETLKRINQIFFVHLLIQPATRSNKIHFDISSINKENISYANSFNLCKWADIVICMSSIMFEVLLQNKVFMNARFLHGETLITDEFGVGWIVNSYEELENAFKKLYNEREYRPYTKENVDRLITEVIYNGIKERDVLGEYRKYILGKITNEYYKESNKHES